MSYYLSLYDITPFPGFGNILMIFSEYYMICRMNNIKPIVYTNTPEKIVGIKKNLFTFVDVKPEGIEYKYHVSLSVLTFHRIIANMRIILDVPEVELPDGVIAGYSFRFSDKKYDEDFTFMNEKCIDSMKQTFNKFGRVFVCSNNNEFIKKLKEEFGDDKIFSVNDLTENKRFDNNQLIQWSLLSKCNFVFHFVKTVGSHEKEITSTFAPTAGFYGGSNIYGIDNNGDIFYEKGYYW